MATETLYFYISQRFALFTVFAVLGLLLLGVSYLLSRRRVVREAHCLDEPCCHDPDHSHEHGAGHEHHQLSWAGMLLVLSPIVLGLLVAPQPLGAPALDNRDLSPNVQGSAMPAAVRRAAEKATVDYNLLDWYYLLRVPETASLLDGADADVAGFVYHDPALDEGAFWLVRFTLSCCVADASPMSVLVQWPGASDLDENQWVQVQGQIDAAQMDNRNLPSLEATKVELITAPAQPYLYQ